MDLEEAPHYTGLFPWILEFRYHCATAGHVSAVMIRSMTAFARRERTGEWGSAQWELRSVNHRYLDITTKLPEDFRSLEPGVRERVRSRLSRGKVDCGLRVSYSAAHAAAFRIDLALAGRLADATREVDHLIHDPARVSSMDILRWPGVILPPSIDLEHIGAAVLELLDEALTDLVETREREGEKIGTLIAERCKSMEGVVAGARVAAPEARTAAKARLETRLAELVVEVDPERLEQEVALLVQKADVTEELDRLHAHLGEVRRVLEHEDAAGRRLDFLMQELNREANTLGAKSFDAAGARSAVDLKVLIEQMREQIQNVE